MRQNWIGTEHLLLGVGRTTEPAVADEAMQRIFRELGLTLEQLRAEVVALVPPKDAPRPPNDLTLTPRSRRILELAIEEAKTRHSERVEPEHLLLALVRETEGVGAQVLARLGATAERLREVVDQPGA